LGADRRRFARRSDRHGTHDVLLDHHIGRPADQHQVLDVVAANEDEPTAPVDGSCIDHGQPRLAPAPGGCAESCGPDPADHPQEQRNQCQHDNERDDEFHSERRLSAEQTVEHRSRSFRPDRRDPATQSYG
jgi:hypothetical protein